GLFLLINEEGEEETYPLEPVGYSGATNNQMELEACVRALRLATSQNPPFDRSRYRKIVIRTDAEYVAGNYETALFTWSGNGWLKRSGAPVDNATQWKELVQFIRRSTRQGKPVTIKWVPGKRSPRTKVVDKAAKKAAKTASPRQLVPSEVRRKRSSHPIELGSVGMEGQLMTINVFKTEYQRLHHLVKCWYTVESRKSRFRDRADVIYADPSLPLRRGHSFRVRVNDNTANPRVLKVFAEID
ncbi:MAG: RNase H family protein, partial [bacterium]